LIRGDPEIAVGREFWGINEILEELFSQIRDHRRKAFAPSLHSPEIVGMASRFDPVGPRECEKNFLGKAAIVWPLPFRPGLPKLLEPLLSGSNPRPPLGGWRGVFSSLF
jgi:hypothetical protein